MYVCVCKGIRDSEIREMAENGVCSLYEIGQCCGAGQNCGRCCPMIRSILSEMELQGEGCDECPVKQSIEDDSSARQQSDHETSDDKSDFEPIYWI